ncbi:hypothetical protein EPN83_03540 [Patescibacteria group bacterium]|nr:MAG: hypothetical protein EPN83_03540 [Patescibacteria group bacterium]
MTENDLKAKLETELALLERELKTVGRRNPANPEDWEPTPAPLDTSAADESEVADTFEEFESNTAVLKQLEIRYNEVKRALDRLEKGTYGKCEVCGRAIEPDRLEANPAATTCKEHMS